MDKRRAMRGTDSAEEERKMEKKNTERIDKKEKTTNLLIDYLEKITDTNDGLITSEHIASVPAVAESITKLLSL